MSNEKEVKRFMKNIDTGAIFPWAEKAIQKLNMFECDKDGNVVVEHQSIADGDMLAHMQELVEDKKKLKAKVEELEKELLRYVAAYGPIDSKLPEAKKPAPAPVPKKEEALAPAPEPKEEETTEDEAPDKLTGGPETSKTPEPRLTKASLAKALFEENGIKVNPKNYKLDELIKMKDEADTASPEEMTKAEYLLK